MALQVGTLLYSVHSTLDNYFYKIKFYAADIIMYFFNIISYNHKLNNYLVSMNITDFIQWVLYTRVFVKIYL